MLFAGLMGGTWGFRHIVPPLVAAGHRVIVADPFDPAQKASAVTSLTTLSDRWAKVLAALGVENATVVAHSLASSLVLRMAARHSELVGAIVSLEGGMVDQFATPGIRRAAAMAPLLRVLGATGIIRRRIGSSLKERSANGRWVTREVVEIYSRPLVRDTQHALALLRSLADAHEPTPIADEARTIRSPVLLLVGDARPPSGPGDAEIARMRAALQSFRLETIVNSGHFLHEEQPRAVVDHIVLIDQQSRASRLAGATNTPD